MHRVNREEVELEKSVRRLMEKFHLRAVTVELATVLMRRFANNHDLVTRYIILFKDQIQAMEQEDVDALNNDPVAQNVVQRIRNGQQQQNDARRMQNGNQGQRNNIEEDPDVRDLGQQLALLPLTERNVRMFNNARQNQIPFEEKQFACQACDSMWWRRVPVRKMVSRCHRCRVKYEPVPLNRMWGAAEFRCTTCNRTFRGYGQMEVSSPCYSCGTPVTPTAIIPPRRQNRPRNRNPHSCAAEDCYNRREPHVPGTLCPHPRSRERSNLPKVLFASHVHDSTGSTVATCISQGSLLSNDINDLIMDDIAEASEEDDEDGSDN
ncbi:shiftless antiviral inhibitor of ribosomal frameshifting protein [Protopterus annectens]|uniref:shiftless antiviral inhibitor of ribosomal frameshifting protein n=1 Tax=Protopterus annectens TaxID=7888 RepID=UPI001CFB3F42|nr:shiftless antiviral inhibitor of ribosomal frameshifting protein [Protopterus annectens]